MIALDASVLIAHLNPVDLHHREARDILLTGTPGELLVHTVTLAEVLVGGVRTGQGVSMRDDLVAAGIVVAAQDPGEPLRLAQLRATSRLKMPDCCVLDVAMRCQAHLATFDHALAAEARRRGVPAVGA